MTLLCLITAKLHFNLHNLLPDNLHIPPVFESLSDEAVTEPMEKLAAYIKKQWIDTPPPPQQLERILLCDQNQQRRFGVALPAQP